MTPLEERNHVWNLLELIIIKNGLKIDMESLNPNSENCIEFGNFVKGNPMNFCDDFEKTIIELERKLPNSYKITKANIYGTGEGHISICKIL